MLFPYFFNPITDAKEEDGNESIYLFPPSDEDQHFKYASCRKGLGIPDISHHMLDRRGRTPLHYARAGFRTEDRPHVIHAILLKDPSSVLIADHNGRTAFSLLYDDYAEEIDDVLQVTFSNNRLRNICLSESSRTCNLETNLFGLSECWKIEDSPAIISDCNDTQTQSDGEQNESVTEEKKIPERFNGKHKNESSNSNSPIGSDCSQPDTEWDLQGHIFHLIHATAACLYLVTHGFFQLSLIIVGASAVQQRDSDFHLPLMSKFRNVQLVSLAHL